MERRLTEAERLAALGRLAAGVAHEVRNPLNAMQLTMQQMRDKISAPAAAASAGPEETPTNGATRPAEFEVYYEIVTGELTRLNQLVSSFLDLARSSALALEPVAVVDSLGRSAALFQNDAAARGVEIVVERDGDERLPLIQGDPARLPTVWNNLISNALAAARPDGRVTLRARPAAEGVEISCEDDGAGIPAEDLERIWEPFYSGRPDGTGLGLSIARAVVEQHGGSIHITSTAGAGTQVTVYLPCEPPAAASTEVSS
jgi:signal transduction histidine kinase